MQQMKHLINDFSMNEAGPLAPGIACSLSPLYCRKKPLLSVLYYDFFFIPPSHIWELARWDPKRIITYRARQACFDSYCLSWWQISLSSYPLSQLLAWIVMMMPVSTSMATYDTGQGICKVAFQTYMYNLNLPLPRESGVHLPQSHACAERRLWCYTS